MIFYLVIVFLAYGNGGITSQQIPMPDNQTCQQIKATIETKTALSGYRTDAYCIGGMPSGRKIAYD